MSTAGVAASTPGCSRPPADEDLRNHLAPGGELLVGYVGRLAPEKQVARLAALNDTAAYASLDVFMPTGPHETFCQAVQEAMASGLPVIAPDAGGPRDLVEPGQTGFLLPPKDFDVRHTVERLRDGAIRWRMGMAARSGVLGRTWPAVCDELLGHYRQVAGQPARVA